MKLANPIEIIEFGCDGCGRPFHAFLADRGRVFKCPDCKTPISIPMRPMPRWMAALWWLKMAFRKSKAIPSRRH